MADLQKFKENSLKTQEELRQQIAFLTQMCNTSHPFRDDQDPFGDGGSASGIALHSWWFVGDYE